MRAMILTLAGTLLGLWLGRADVPSLSAADDPAKSEPAKSASKEKQRLEPALKKFMQAKLGLSQSLLEGLVLEDFDKIGNAAESLSALSQAEQWRISNDALYKQHSAEFLRATRQLTKGAKENNLDAASLGFVKLTMSCVECHRFVRNELIADRPQSSGG